MKPITNRTIWKITKFLKREKLILISVEEELSERKRNGIVWLRIGYRLPVEKAR